MPLPPDTTPNDEYKALLREVVGAATDAIRVSAQSTETLKEIRPLLEQIAAERKRSNDLQQRALDAADAQNAAAQTERSQARLFLENFGKGICKMLDSRWSTIVLAVPVILQIAWYALGWTDHPPALLIPQPVPAQSAPPTADGSEMTP